VAQLPSKAPYSKRFEEAVGQACESAAARQGARLLGLAASTVRAIDLRHLERWDEKRRQTPKRRYFRLTGKPGRGYLESMSEQTIQLLDAFESLPSDDKLAFVVEIMRRTRELPFDSGPITDEEIGEAGKAMFALLDRDENAQETGTA
jgi:hypothetical protein